MWTAHTHPEGYHAGSCVTFLSDGQTIATGGVDGKVRLWDLKGHEQATLPFSKEKEEFVEALAVSPDGRLLAAGGDNPLHTPCYVVVWNLASRKEVSRLDIHDSSVEAVVFSPDGTQMYVALEGPTLAIYALE